MSEKFKRGIGTVFVSFTIAIVGTLFTLGIYIFIFDGSIYTTQPEPTPTEHIEPPEDGEKENVVVEIKGYEEIVVPIAQKLRSSIVGIRVRISEGVFDSSLFYEASGVVYTSDGYIITNQHVLASAIDASGNLADSSSVRVFVEDTEEPYEAELVGYDSLTDLALLKIDATDLKSAVFGDSENINVGQMVVAIGSPGGLQFMGSVSQGIISGIDREVEFGGGTIMQLIQTDAAVNPGNSGGALVNAEGEVIGINNAGLEKTTYEGINFAIPSNLVIDIVESLKTDGYIAGRAWLGIYVMDDMEFDSIKLLYDLPDGIFVSDLDKDGPAYEYGIRKSDVIIEAEGMEIARLADLRRILNEKSPGDSLKIKVFRPLVEEELEFEVILGQRKS